MMKLLDIKMISVVMLFVVQHTGKSLEFDSSYYYFSSYPDQLIEIIPANKSYEIMVTENIINTYLENEIKRSQAQKVIQVNCLQFISFYKQDEGIYTCQDDYGRSYPIASTGVKHNQDSNNYRWRVICNDLISDIIEGKEVQVLCTVQPIPDKSYYEAEMTIGWIQGQHNITQSLHLNKGETIHVNQTFFGFNSGEGIFFYCIHTGVIYCYTLILEVCPQLKVTIIALCEKPDVFGQCCFQCLATGGTGGAGEKVYTWNLHNSKMTLKDEYKSKICLENLTTGEYTIECLVSTNAQNSSNVIEFIVKEDITTETTTTTQQDDQDSTTKDLMATDARTTPQTTAQHGHQVNCTRDDLTKKRRTTQKTAFQMDDIDDINKVNNRFKITVIFLAATTTILVFVVFILVYILKRKHKSQGLHTVMYNQQGIDIGVRRTSAALQIDADDGEYHTIENASAEPTDNDYVEPNVTHSKRDTDAEICNGRDAETPFYFVLEK